MSAAIYGQAHKTRANTTAIVVKPAVTLEFRKLVPDNLYDEWPFLERGAVKIIERAKPDWQIAHLYNMLAGGSVTAWIAQRGERKLGWFAGYPQQRIFSRKWEWFLLCCWTLPLKERLPEDNFPEVVAKAKEFWLEQMRACGGDRIVTLSYRPYDVYGFTPGHRTWVLK